MDLIFLLCFSRKLVAESNVDYSILDDIYKSKAESDDVKSIIKTKLRSDIVDEDIDELVTMFDNHFIATNANVSNGSVEVKANGDSNTPIPSGTNAAK